MKKYNVNYSYVLEYDDYLVASDITSNCWEEIVGRCWDLIRVSFRDKAGLDFCIEFKSGDMDTIRYIINSLGEGYCYIKIEVLGVL